ncbi:hypothetical protein GWA97_10120 [Flavobacterium sp. LaA7.5]|nr:hypothetical protein [Flavobacterium salilacus subsp. altitudinum]
MKSIFFTLMLIFFIIGCGDDKDIIDNRISQLEIENKILKDSINKMKYNNVVTSEMVLLPSYSHQNKDIVSGIFRQRQSFPKFELYHANEQFEYSLDDKINYENDGHNAFRFNNRFNDDELLRVVAVFDLDSVNVELYGVMPIDNGSD